MTSLTFYDHQGTPICYTDDHKIIYLFGGQPVAYLIGDGVYDFGGKHLGRFDNGWVRDNKGECVFFTVHASFGPTKPVRKTEPTKWTKKSVSTPTVPEHAPVRLVDKLTWSKLSGPQFFDKG